MNDHWAIDLPLHAVGLRSIEAGSPPRSDEPPSETEAVIEFDHLLAPGIYANGELCQVDLMEILPIEVIRWLDQRESKRYLDSLRKGE